MESMLDLLSRGRHPTVLERRDDITLQEHDCLDATQRGVRRLDESVR